MTAAPSPRRDDDDDASRPPASRSPPPASPSAPASPTAPGDSADAPDDENEIFATPGGDGTGADGDDRAADAATGAEAAAPPVDDDSDPLDAAFANARAETDAALHAMNDWVASAQEEAEHAAKEAERLAQDAAEAVSGLFGDAFAWGAAEPAPEPAPEPVPEPARGSGDPTATGARANDPSARANDPSREANARASNPDDPDPETDPMLAELSAGFSSLWTDAETAMRDAAISAEALLAGGPAEDEKPAALAPPDREENRQFIRGSRTSATRRRRPVALKPGELRAAFPSLPRGAVVVGDFACELQLRYALEVPAALAGRVRGARRRRRRGAVSLLITDRHACFAFDRGRSGAAEAEAGEGEGVGEGYSHSSSGSERFGPENLRGARGDPRDGQGGGARGRRRVLDARGGFGSGGEEASGEEGSLRLVGFEDAAESDAAMALLEHLRESTER